MARRPGARWGGRVNYRLRPPRLRIPRNPHRGRSRGHRNEQALISVVQEAYVAGVSTRKVDQVVESLGLRISKSEVSWICQGLDEQVDAFRNRPLEGCHPAPMVGREGGEGQRTAVA